MRSSATGQHIRTAARRYCDLLGLIALTNHGKCAPLAELGGNSITLGSPYVRLFADSRGFGDEFVWCEDEQCRPVRELLTTPEGRQEFADWLLKLRDAEKQAVEALERALECEDRGAA